MPDPESNPFDLLPGTEAAASSSTAPAPSATKSLDDDAVPASADQAETAKVFTAIAAAYRDGKPRRIVVRAKVLE